MAHQFPPPIFSHSCHTPAPDAPKLNHDSLCQAKMAVSAKRSMSNVEIL